MDEDNWSIVCKPKRVKSSEIKSLEDYLEKQEQENNLLLIRSMLRKNDTANKKFESAKKTQIPVIKSKPREQPTEKPPKTKKKTESPSNTPTTYKSLPAALASLNLREFQDLLEATKAQFNNHDVIMLKTINTFLNEKLRLEKAEDSLFFDKPLDYPDNILPVGLKKVIRDVIEERSHQSRQYFFHTLLQSLCEELNRSRNFIGHLILLQQIAFIDPEVCITNLASTVILRNSYQNQPPICLSMFWALSSAGLVNTYVGLKVWMEIVSSVMNVKSYTKYCYDFLEKILKASRQTSTLDMPLEEFKNVVELLLTNVQKVKSKDLQKIKDSCVEMLTEKVVRSVTEKNVESLFLLLLNFSKRYPELFVRGIIDCIELHPLTCLRVWKLNFDSYSKVNLFVLNYLYNNIGATEKLCNSKPFLQFIKQIDCKVHQNLVFVKDIPAKMTDSKKQKKQKKGSGESSGCSSCCKWLFGSFVLFSAIAGLIAYDTNVLHDGKFEESSVGRVLKQTGALPHVENAWFVSLKFSAKGYKWVEANAPVYYGKTRVYMQPFCEFTKDLALTVLNGVKKGWESTKVFVAEKTPVVIAFIDKYVPGLGQKIHDFIVNTCKNVCSFTCNGWKQSVEFFKAKVFVGQLSPENLGKALNSTTQRALGYYSWFHDKVDFYAKIN